MHSMGYKNLRVILYSFSENTITDVIERGEWFTKANAPDSLTKDYIKVAIKSCSKIRIEAINSGFYLEMSLPTLVFNDKP